MSQPPRQTVLIAEEDPAARRRLRELLSRRSDVTVVAECASGEDAVRAIRDIRPDLVLLDAQMPDLDGFGVVEKVGVESMPAVLFITGFDSHALRAFEVHALDYLLEPFDDERFYAALDRVRRHVDRLALAGLGRRLGRLLEADEEGSRERRIPIRTAGKVQFVPLDEIRWVESVGSYVRLHRFDGKTHLLRENLRSLAQRFADDFVRIHHSTLVRSSEILEIRRSAQGDALVVLRDGSVLRVGRHDRQKLEPVLPSSDGRRSSPRPETDGTAHPVLGARRKDQQEIRGGERSDDGNPPNDS